MAGGEDALLLACEQVGVRRGGRLVVQDVDLELRRGEVVAVLGPNGAGKSTLLDALVGAIAPATGAIRRLGRIAIALQSPDLARRTVLANVELALAWWGVPRLQRRPRALEALRTFGVEQLGARQAVELSGGERRRVHLARALAVRADVLLLDEPFAGLDAEARGNLLQDSVSVLRSPARATLVVVHDRTEAFALADRLLILIDGRLVASGAPRELLASPPTSETARFLGYDGELIDPSGDSVMTRPPNVIIDPDGPLPARVLRVLPLEDAVKLELELARDGSPPALAGRVFALAPIPGPAPGEELRIRLDGAVRFPAASGPEGSVTRRSASR